MTTQYSPPQYHHSVMRRLAAGTLMLSALTGAPSWADHTENPTAVSIPGDLQTTLGCAENWAPDCAESQLSLGDDGLWRGAFSLAAGDYEYKAAINNSWDENYGAGAEPNGGNIALSLSEPEDVRFYYSHGSHWVADSENHVIAAAVGDFQTALGCPGNWAPDCLRAWVQDPNNTGIYQFTTTEIPPGDYEAKIALNESWDISYGNGSGGNVPFSVTEAGEAITFSYNSLDNSVVVGDVVSTGDLTSAKAYWLDAQTIAWAVPTEANVELHFDAEAQLNSGTEGVTGGESLTLTHNPDGMSDALAARFPHLADYPVFTLDASSLEQVPEILKQQIAVSASNEEGNLIDATGIQIPGVLDDLYAYDGALGPGYNDGTPSVHLWAPTAQSVTFMLYADGQTETATELPMTFDPNSGVWSVTGSADWDQQYYRFNVEVYVPSTQTIENNLVTDPYTLGANTDGTRSQLVNLNAAELKPEGWDEIDKPTIAAPEDMVVYELHMRDFSVSDAEVPAEWRGTFKAFTVGKSHGMTHLKSLQEAGLSHVHLLPAFDCATIPEDPANRSELEQDLSVYEPNGTEQQAAIEAIRATDAFNWCYDPHHYTVPEGSYATSAEGVARIIEFREMVQALNEAGLRVVMDVVYNHTSQALLGEKSVLDKVVPGYYHRLNASGDIERSTCCENTATEHAMMEKLMVDSLATWAEMYKVDGFRFDLMGHHSKANMLAVQERLSALTEEENGVNGESIYLYGEGWNFGEVADNARFEQATQLNMAGTGIGTFNDRLRDAVRGGSPFDTGITHVQNQGFINGLYYDPNAENEATTDDLEWLLTSTDRIRIGLTGNLKDFAFTDWQGNEVTGDYGAQVGYTSDPQETINYIAAHDNETLFDINQYKIPLDRDLDTRVRVQNLGNSLILLSQGIPFMHAGQEMLRSKSMDRDSYDSGDWFNLLDYSYTQNGWGRGLPPAHSTEASWDQISPRLADETLAVGTPQIEQAIAHTKEMLAIRKSSKLFRLETGADVMAHLSFENTGAEQKPALVAMKITDSEADWDPEREMVMVLFNAHIEAQTLTKSDWEDQAFELHPVQQESSDARLQEAAFDPDSGTFTIPARTTAVFQVTQEPEDDDANGNDDDGEDDEEPDRSGSGSIPLWTLLTLALLSVSRQRR